jgi:hypothetical protein
MSAEFLAMVAGVVLSLAFSYIPGLSARFDTLSGEGKRLAMLALLFAVAAGSIGLACAGFAADLGLSLTCDRAGIVGTLQAFFLAAMANQAAYALSPKPDRAVG